jgi:hypothetical protein
MSQWIRVTPKEPCPVCGKGDWCGLSQDRTLACCMRTESGTTVKNGGWLHRIGGRSPIPTRPLPPPDDSLLAPAIDAQAIWTGYRTGSLCATAEAAVALGLPMWTTWEIGAGIDPQGNLAFPMRDGNLAVTGIRLRSADGKKWAVKGSRAGVFTPTRYNPQDWENAGHAVVVEGPTDAAAVLAIDLIPIGRPSCLGCEQILIDAARTLGATALTVVADNDGPGVMGARRLCTALAAAGVRHRLVTAGGHKDMRKWWQTGTTRKTVELTWAQALWK